jgi:DNA-binding transcriptional LysR family regulator
MIDRLEFILALARESHFGRAAEACGVSQPTLSAGIKYLEEMFGVMLVQRGSRFHGFTPEGERVLEWARRIVGDSQIWMPADQDSIPKSARPSRACSRPLITKLIARDSSLPSLGRESQPMAQLNAPSCC